ncbi:MAG: LysR family transcriptional regulator [Pigmentiphaga sp.]
MNRKNLTDLQAFITVAREQSFTRAAAQLGLSRSALSHAISAMERRLGLRLLTRTTRSVSTTEAGARLLITLEPRLAEIYAELDALSEFRQELAGLVRISATDYVIRDYLWPKLKPLLQTNPKLKIELCGDYGLTDIVAERFDAGVRIGDLLEKDMIAVPLAPNRRFAIVASPDYLKTSQQPRVPDEITQHRCIGLRFPTHGGLASWKLERDGQSVRVKVEGQAIFNSAFQVLEAALDGTGLAYLPFDQVKPYVDELKLVPILEDWWPTYSLYLYYPSRREGAPAFAAVVDALKYQADVASARNAIAIRPS